MKTAIDKLLDEIEATRIRVTKTHINKGHQGEPHSCAVALAFKDTFHRCRHVAVLPGDRSICVGFRVSGKLVKIRCSLPDFMVNFIEEFDEKERVNQMDPIEFQLDQFKILEP